MYGGMPSRLLGSSFDPKNSVVFLGIRRPLRHRLLTYLTSMSLKRRIRLDDIDSRSPLLLHGQSRERGHNKVHQRSYSFR